MLSSVKLMALSCSVVVVFPTIELCQSDKLYLKSRHLNQDKHSINMKAIIACCLLLAVTAQAAVWAKVKPVYRTRPTLRHAVRSKIIGGSISTPGQFPYQVGLYLDGSGFCGGSLIKDDVILTAGHCADGTRNFKAHLGAQNIYDETEPTRVIVTSTNGILHEFYNPSTINNDIAVVKLTAPVSGAGIGVVRLPARSQLGETFNGVSARVSGWGRTSDSIGAISSELKFVDVTVIDNSECASYYGNIINDSKICVDTLGGTAGTCNGDSGGPLVITEADGEVTEIGIVSFGSSAGCESGAPAAFTRVSEYLPWLETNAGVTIRP
ncbi:brachyurin-like [Neocloeon triangulifer]|uniref:brachyurin-like n=1 Tax=Neocloeon triangulifer TaxID=2078957 RepID=UPI00286F5622|nr:brachyurin-like [Neocloeon triangulifer]